MAFGALFAWAVSGLVANRTFSPQLRNDLLVAGMIGAVLVTGTLFYVALGTVILDVGQPQLWVDDTGIKAPALVRYLGERREPAVADRRAAEA